MADGNETTVYVVQVAESLWRTGKDPSEDKEVGAWVDLPLVRVPARTKRSTVIREALKAANMTPPVGGRLEVRVLGPEEAEPTIVLPPETAPGPRELRL